MGIVAALNNQDEVFFCSAYIISEPSFAPSVFLVVCYQHFPLKAADAIAFVLIQQDPNGNCHAAIQPTQTRAACHINEM